MQKVDINLYTNAVVPVFFCIETMEDPAGFQFQGHLYAAAAPATSVLQMTCEWDAANKRGIATYDPAAVATLLGTLTSLDLLWVLLGKPGTTYAVPFFAGAATLKLGGPGWSA
jgi:hypothetical protein